MINGISLIKFDYVLSVLSFTYPTIYQGWQTLVGGILLRILFYKLQWLGVSPTPLDKAGFVSLLPAFLFFVAGIVASSKALASLSVCMFLCLHNTLSSLLYLLELCPYIWSDSAPPDARAIPSKVGATAAILIVFIAFFAVVLDLKITFSESPYFWLFVSLACVAVQKLHIRIADARYTEIDRLYCSYVFSVVVLAPASLYLEEAFEALHFPHASRLDFMLACLLVGVLSLMLALYTIRIQEQPCFSRIDAGSKLLSGVIASMVFPDAPRGLVLGLVLMNLSLGLLVPGFGAHQDEVCSDAAEPILVKQ